MRQVNIIVRMMYTLIKKLKNEEYLRELRVLGRDIGTTSKYYNG